MKQVQKIKTKDRRTQMLQYGWKTSVNKVKVRTFILFLFR